MSLTEELRAERVGNLDISAFTQVSHTTTVRETVARMRDKRHDVCLIVDEDSKLVGIFTGREFIRKDAIQSELLDAPISEIMIKELTPIRADMVAADAFALLDKKRFQNLPVIDENDQVLGNMSHHSVMNFLADQYPEIIVNHPPRPDRFPRKAEGG